MNILVAFDGTREARQAARLAARHAKAMQGRVILAHSMVGGPEIPRQDFERAEKELKLAELALKEEGVDCESLLSVRGLEPGEDILTIAREKKADEIVIGIERRSKVGKLLFGSTAQYIILNAECPVVTVR